MILPGNSRQVIIDALQGFSEAPNITASKVVNDLDDAGFRVVHHEELAGILSGLISLAESPVPAGRRMDADAVIRAKAMLEVLKA